jgi:hypothetical protein
MNIFGLGLLADQNDLLPQIMAELIGAIGIEHRDARGGTGRGRQALGDRLDLRTPGPGAGTASAPGSADRYAAAPAPC